MLAAKAAKLVEGRSGSRYSIVQYGILYCSIYYIILLYYVIVYYIIVLCYKISPTELNTRLDVREHRL